MHLNAEEFACLLASARRGEIAGFHRLSDWCAGHLRAVVRQRLNPLLQPLCDSEDILQSVWLRVFDRSLLWHSFDGPEQFLGFMRRLVEREVYRLHRRFLGCRKRDLRRRRGPPSPANGEALEAPDPHQIRPIDFLLVQESLVLALQQVPHASQVVKLLREGLSSAEVATALELTERRVQQVVHLVCHLVTGLC